MPNDANSRGVSAVTAVVLFMALLCVGYINATYQGTVGSIPICGAGALIAVAMFAKLGYAFGITACIVTGLRSLAFLGSASHRYYIRVRWPRLLA